MVVGLGNPGVQYVGTRHNVGADVVFLLADRHGGHLTFSKRDRAMVDDVIIRSAGAGRVGDIGLDAKVALAFPQTYMNESGQSVRLLLRRHDLDDPSRVIVVHDELDLPPGRVRVKEGGGLAGHNGLRSIKDHLHADAFLRIRIGIGKPPGGKERGADHVLKKPSKVDREELAVAVHEAADAVEMILAEGVAKAMNRYNASPPA